MSKEIKNSTISDPITPVELFQVELAFAPSPAQRKAKAKYWARSDGLLGNPESSSAQTVSSYIKEPGIKKWWAIPGFKEWFFNEQETKERLEYLFMLALDTAEEVLLNPEANASAKVNMIKVLALLSGKDSSNKERLLDDSIQRMSALQLKEFIRAQAPKLLESENKVEE